LALSASFSSVALWAPWCMADGPQGDLVVLLTQVRQMPQPAQQPGAAVGVVHLSRIVGLTGISEADWHGWLFGASDTLDSRRQALQSLQRLLGSLDAEAQLAAENGDAAFSWYGPAQRARLELAGQVDIGRFFDDCEALRVRMAAKEISERELQALMPLCEAAQRRYAAGLFGHDSLWMKTLRQIVPEPDLESVQARLSAALSKPSAQLTPRLVDAAIQARGLMLLRFDRNQRRLHEVVLPVVAQQPEAGAEQP